MENVVYVYFPLKAKRIFSKNIFYLTFFGMLVISIFINSHFIWTSNVFDSACHSFSPLLEDSYRIAQFVITIFLNSILPNLIQIVLNWILLKKLIYLNRINRRRSSGTFKRKSLARVTIKRFIIKSLVFFLIVLPLHVFNGLSVINYENNFEVIYNVRQIFSLLLCSYYSLYFLIHFYVYTPVVSRKRSL